MFGLLLNAFFAFFESLKAAKTQVLFFRLWARRAQVTPVALFLHIFKSVMSFLLAPQPTHPAILLGLILS